MVSDSLKEQSRAGRLPEGPARIGNRNLFGDANQTIKMSGSKDEQAGGMSENDEG